MHPGQVDVVRFQPVADVSSRHLGAIQKAALIGGGIV